MALVTQNEPNALYILMKSEPKDGNELGGFVDQLTPAVHKHEPISDDNKCQSNLGCLSLLDHYIYVSNKESDMNPLHPIILRLTNPSSFGEQLTGLWWVGLRNISRLIRLVRFGLRFGSFYISS